MSSRDISSPRLPLPIGNVDQAYIIDLVRALDLFIQQSDNPGEGRNTKLVFTDMPTSDIGLEPGTLYRFGNDVKISLLNIAGVDGLTATATLGSVTVSV
jgi:hypothetical protein|tara:strand:+ start:776 stop:1072 length:297 start_codon:yes stop_codon:yes gene_type:complete